MVQHDIRMTQERKKITFKKVKISKLYRIETISRTSVSLQPLWQEEKWGNEGIKSLSWLQLCKGKRNSFFFCEQISRKSQSRARGRPQRHLWVSVAIKKKNPFFIVGPLNDVVAQSHRNIMDRSRKVRITFLNWSLSVTWQFRENCQKRFKLQIKGPRSAQTNFFIKLKISGTPKLCWADEVKFEF